MIAMNGDESADKAFLQPRAWGVSALVRALADALSARFNPITVRGEITGFSKATSGHCYFTLKDTEPGADSAISCAMFRRTASLIDFAPKNGDVVELRGRVAVYEARGSLQLVAEHLQKVQTQAGQLWAKFEQIKAQLAAEGLFDADLKRPIPRFVSCVALVTSRQAAALQDVLTALARRAPHVRLLVFPCAVQGAAAPGEIVESLASIEQYNEQILGQTDDSVLDRSKNSTSSVHPGLVDGLAQFSTASISARRAGSARTRDPRPRKIDAVLLVRGGGSLEDLWAFNEMQVVRAVRACSVPLICGVGHETDFSLCDFAADLRAPTPTAAAELVSQPTAAWAGALDLAQARLRDAVIDRLNANEQRLDQLAHTLGRPQERLQAQRQKLDRLLHRMRHHLLLNVERKKQQILRRSADLEQKRHARVAGTHARLDQLGARLHALDPQRVLERGYAMLQSETGQVLSSAAQLAADAKVKARLHDGEVDLRVLSPSRPSP